MATGPRPRSSRDFDDRTLGGTLRVGLQLQNLGLQQDGFFQLLQPELLQRRDLDIHGVATQGFDDDLVLQQFLAHAVGIRTRAVDLVDRHDDGHLRRLGVFDRLDGLRHHAVIGGDDQHHDIGGGGTARAHGGKGLMARRIQEGDGLAGGQGDLIGADMLGDATSLASRHIRMAQRVQQAGLAVIDMAHDGDDRRARLQLGIRVLFALQAQLNVRIRDAADLVAEFGDDQLGGIGVDGLGDGGHHAHFHQGAHHIAAGGGHAVGEFLHGDGFGQHDLAHHFQAVGAQQLQLGLAALTLTLAAHGGERTGLLILTLNGGLHVDAAGAAVAVADLFHRGGGHAALGRRGGGAARAARGVLVLFRAGGAAAGFELQGAARRRGGGGAGGLPSGGAGSGRGSRARGLGRLGGGGLGRFQARLKFRRGGRGGFSLGLGLGGGGFLFGLAARIILGLAAGFLGGGEDGNLFLLAALGLALGGGGQHALAVGELGGGQGARGAIAALRTGALPGGRGRGRGGCCGCRRALGLRTQRQGGGRRGGGASGGCGGTAALLANLDLHNLRAAMREALPHGPGIDSMPGIAARGGAQRKPAALGFILVVAVTHA